MIRSHDAQAAGSLPFSGVRECRPASGVSPAGEAPSLDRACVEVPGTSRLATEDAGLAGPGLGLPSELLEGILAYLPLSDQGRCALVCRRWYGLLSETRWKLALHMERLSADQRWVTGYLAEGYRSRTRAFLEQGRSPLLPALDRQDGERLRLLQQRQEAQATGPSLHKSLQRACALVSGLVNYGLQQISQTCPLRLQPAAVKGGEVFQTSVSFSPCSRWMATRSWQAEAGRWSSQPCLYGWSEGGWHRQTLSSPPASPVSAYSFSLSQPDTLLTGHRQGQVIRWHTAEGTGRWQATPVLELGQRYRVLSAVDNRHGDLIVLYKGGEPGRKYVRVVSNRVDGQHKAPVAESFYGPESIDSFNKGRTRLAVVTQPAIFGDGRGSVDIWQRDLNAVEPGAWGYQRTLLFPGQGLKWLLQSPDGCHLLGLQACGRAKLWALDADCRMHLCLNAPCTFSMTRRDMSAWRPFSNDGRQLVLAESAHQIQFWNLQEEGGWAIGACFDSTPCPAPVDGDFIRYLQLSGDGQTLACATGSHVALWHKNDDAWQQVLQRCVTDTDVLPQIARRPLGLYISTVGRQEGWDRLCLHGADSQGQLVEKYRFSVQESIRSIQVSPDGLTVLVFFVGNSPPAVLKLEAQPPDGTGEPFV